MSNDYFKQHLLPYPTPKTTGGVVKSETLVERLTNPIYSTHLASWTNSKLKDTELEVSPLAVFPELDGALQHIFPDTVVVRVKTRITYGTSVEDGKERNTQAIPIDPTAISRSVQELFGLVGTVAGCQPIEGSTYGYQEYYIATCNLSLPVVYNICQRLIEGQYSYEGYPIEFVRMDTTTNIPSAVMPSADGSYYLESLGWRYKDNRKQVGETCHTYILSDNLETKIYDKFRYMLEVGAISNPVGDNYKNILLSNQANIVSAFRSEVFQQQGFGRIETRWYRSLPTLEEVIATHIDCMVKLASEHCEPTSFQDSWDSFLQPNHSQTLVLVEDVNYTKVKWTFARSVNKLTEKANGWSGEGLEDAIHTLKHRTFGCYPVEVFWVRRDGRKGEITHRGTLLPDNLHLGSLVRIGGGQKTQAAVCNSGLSWADVGLDIPLSLDNTNRKPRNLVFRTNVEDGVDICLESLKTLERKAKKAEQKKQRRLAKDVEKAVAQVAKDKFAKAPVDWKKHRHVSELAEVAKPICTRYYYDSSLKFPTYMLKVGKMWYKANTGLSRLLDKKPPLPLVVEVWDSGKQYNGSTIWDVSVKPYTC